MTVRTRFAPSPTGHVHVGNIRAAIYNWLFARHAGGKFLLRIEDTDRARSTPEAVKTVLDAMEWLGLSCDEEPLSQSTRMEAHLAAAEELLSKGQAYKEDKGGTGQGECVVFKMPGADMSFHDEIKGDLSKKAEDMKDFVIVRSNGTPVFHLANVVDDIHMNITHVIRGDDHIENTYRHVALYEALGASVPKFAHLPMIVNAQGKPYSKRDGAAYVGDFREKGFLADALFNYLALLGWSPKDDREIMDWTDLVGAFEITGVTKTAAIFSPDKLKWMNWQYIRSLSDEELAERIAPFLVAANLATEAELESRKEWLAKLARATKERLHVLTDIVSYSDFLFRDIEGYDEKGVKKRWSKPEAKKILQDLIEVLEGCEPFDEKTIEARCREYIEREGIKLAQLVHPARLALTGKTISPGFFETVELIGKENSLTRLQKAIEYIETHNLGK